MARHQVQAHAHATLMGFGAEIFKIVVRAVSRIDPIEISHVVTGVSKRRYKYRIDPDRVAANGTDIIELCTDPAQIPDSIAVRVVIALGIDLIEYGCLQPTWPLRNFGTKGRNSLTRETKNRYQRATSYHSSLHYWLLDGSGRTKTPQKMAAFIRSAANVSQQIQRFELNRPSRSSHSRHC